MISVSNSIILFISCVIIFSLYIQYQVLCISLSLCCRAILCNDLILLCFFVGKNVLIISEGVLGVVYVNCRETPPLWNGLAIVISWVLIFLIIVQSQQSLLSILMLILYILVKVFFFVLLVLPDHFNTLWSRIVCRLRWCICHFITTMSRTWG